MCNEPLLKFNSLMQKINPEQVLKLQYLHDHKKSETDFILVETSFK